jgi:hypothetical protein
VSWTWEIRFGEVLAAVVAAIAVAFSPWIAIRLQRRYEERREKDRVRRQIFRDLLVNRGSPGAPARVAAVNLAVFEFQGDSQIESDVRVAARAHLAAVVIPVEGLPPEQVAVILDRSATTFFTLLGRIAAYFKVPVDETELRDRIYTPGTHTTLANRQERASVAVLEILEGRRVLPVTIVPLPFGLQQALEAPEPTEESVQKLTPGPEKAPAKK